ncbi:rRNA maturation RNase YbeY [Acidaminococcus fermentans]|uniref:rRNA maturation RNase YbeY n=1 Tax=Acidaminococcus fermentans TaxID=905 RepID=UPI00307A8512
MIVTLENNQTEIAIPEELEETLKKAMDIVARKENLTDNTEVDITIVNNEEIHTLNRDYRGIDRPTDVLSFALDEGDEEPEMTYLAVHGMLHLLGYDHMEEADKRVMRAREEEILRELDLAEEKYGG